MHKNIIVVDDHDLFREGIKVLLKKIKNISIVGEANNGRKAIELFKELRPDLLLIDISMPDMNGIEASKKILTIDPAASIIILSIHDDEDYISSCVSAGVKGYVIKSESGTELQHTIEAVLQGKNYFSHRTQDVILKKIRTTGIRTELQIDINITQRESQILKFIVQGLTSHAMADKLFISTRTVETHRANIMRKLGVKNTVELVKKTIEMNLLKDK